MRSWIDGKRRRKLVYKINAPKPHRKLENAAKLGCRDPDWRAFGRNSDTARSPPVTEPWRLGAAALSGAFAARRVSPVDALESCLDRVALWQPRVNAFAALDPAGARRSAEESARRWAAGRPLSPLDGVPVSVKDNLRVAGLPTRWGSRVTQATPAPADETPAARLRAAGAVLFGKTTLPEFAMQGCTVSPLTGVTRNPWNAALTPGGSSGGAAAAVASGCGPLALATDGGGSIRRPAAHCGLVGFKPSAGAVIRGEGLPEIFLGFESAGVIARSVEDAALALRVLSATPPSRSPPLRRVLFAPRFGDAPVDPAIVARVAAAAARLSARGFVVEEAARFDLSDGINELWPALSAAGLAWLWERPARWPDLAPGADPDDCDAATRAALRDGRAAGSGPLFELLHRIRALERALDALFADHDLILTPAVAAMPWPAETPWPDEIAGAQVGPRGHAVYTALANAAGLPAVALPCGSIDGMPVGLQLIGRRGDDGALLEAARACEAPWSPTERPRPP
jgi:aspartyl-tRNA(Asn)/glutamyl-tRNA(Gln) amidotransferase subunit A